MLHNVYLLKVVILDIKMLSKTENEMSILVEGIPVSLASAIRRAMMSEVPTMAIDSVDFKKNGSALNDEVISNRLGQVPLTFDKKAYNIKDECDNCKGKGCSRCQVDLVLKKKGPGVVYSGDLKSTSKDVQPVFDKIPITELFNPGEEVEFTATAILSTGRKHAKWQGAVVGYKNLASIKIDGDLPGKKEYVDSCPVNVFDLKGGKVVAARPINCILCMNCVDASDGRIRVEPVKESFVFNIETVSGLGVDDVLKGALYVLDAKLDEFAKTAKKLA